MRLTPPKKAVFVIALILAIVGVAVHVLAFFVPAVAPFAGYAIYAVLAGYILLMLGNCVKGF